MGEHLPTLSGNRFISAMKKLGYVRAGQKGSHVRLRCPGRTPLTVPLHSELGKGLLRSLIREAGITVEQLRELL